MFIPDNEMDFRSDVDVKIKNILKYNISDYLLQNDMEVYLVDDSLNHNLLWQEKHAEMDKFIDMGKYTRVNITK